MPPPIAVYELSILGTLFLKYSGHTKLVMKSTFIPSTSNIESYVWTISTPLLLLFTSVELLLVIASHILVAIVGPCFIIIGIIEENNELRSSALA